MGEASRNVDHGLSEKENKMKAANLSLLLFALALMLASTGNAKTVKYIELGFNQSKFRDQDCKSKIGPSFGLGLDYYPIKSFGAFIGTGLLYQNKKLLVEDKKWPSNLYPELALTVYSGDFDVNISYLELPLQIGYQMKLRDQISVAIFSGASLLIPMKDHTRAKNLTRRELTPAERGKFNDYDYYRLDETRVSWSQNFNIGVRLSYNHFGFMFSSAKAISFTQNIKSKTIRGKVDSYKASLAFLF